MIGKLKSLENLNLRVNKIIRLPESVGALKALKKLENNSEFKEWKKTKKDNYLSYALITIEGKKQSGWQFGYYNKKRDNSMNSPVSSIKIACE